jgi:CRP-like cAMP-binding protein
MSRLAKTTTKNQILNAIPSAAWARMDEYLEYIDLPQGKLIYEAEEPIELVYFPDIAIVSVVSTTASGESAEAGLIGLEGMTGVEALFDGPLALNREIVQLPGHGYRAHLSKIKEEFAQGGPFQAAVLIFTRSMLGQMSQTALCNRLHVAEQRLAKWLLMVRDRAETDVLPITQEFAALMLGANRVTLTQAAGQLQDNGFIEYKRGVITIRDRQGLEGYACDCYERIRSEYLRYAQ